MPTFAFICTDNVQVLAAIVGLALTCLLGGGIMHKFEAEKEIELNTQAALNIQKIIWFVNNVSSISPELADQFAEEISDWKATHSPTHNWDLTGGM